MAPKKIALGKPYPTSVLPQGASPAETEVPPGGCSVSRQGQHPCTDPWILGPDPLAGSSNFLVAHILFFFFF